MTKNTQLALPAIIVCDGHIVDSNGAFNDMTGRDKAEVLHSTVDELISDLSHEQHHWSSWQQYLQSQSTCNVIDAKVLTRHYYPLPVKLSHTVLDDGHVKLEFQSFINKSVDPITLLPNGWAMRCHAEHLLRTESKQLALLLISVDNFSTVNYRYGFQNGDTYLAKLGEALTNQATEAVLTVRYSNAKFGILMARQTNSSVDEFIEQCKRLSQQIKVLSFKPLSVTDELSIKKHFSIGVCIQHKQTIDYHPIEIAAETALQQAKKHANSEVVIANSDTNQTLIAKKLIIDELPDALRQNQISLHYQPQYLIGQQTLVGLEALARWQHPTLGTVSPARFVAIAETIGFHLALDIYVFKQVKQQLSDWLARGYNPGKIAINVSFKTVEMPEFINKIATIFAQDTDLISHIEIEVTETASINNELALKTNISTLRNMGFSIAVDDFGTGYSSLKLVRSYHRYFDKLKLDKSIIDPIAESTLDKQFVKQLIELGQTLGLTILAEGVETKPQLDVLEEIGCRFAQGYLFAKPLTSEETASLMQSDIHQHKP
ncbi:EAL domain-containing protein [Shewanella waksmanii]|uniref:EAL domain-containing protein n=1 Tax=Shewanella waksmanii TaxID=213783 RepID=UPI003736CF28